MHNKTANLATPKGTRQVPVAWQGQHLAVHRPIDSNSPTGLSQLPRHWRISHTPTGYAASRCLHLSQRDAVKLAKLWDPAFASVTAAGDAHGWPWRERFADDLRRAEAGRPLIGPRRLTPLEQLDSAGTAAEVQAAVTRAMGYEPVSDADACEQYPAEITKQSAGSGAIRRNPESGELEYWWLPQGGNYPFGDAMALAGWYPVPSMGDVETWCLGSIAETPCGDSVEPDHPDAWPRLLGLI